jgi:hypothetical protein
MTNRVFTVIAIFLTTGMVGLSAQGRQGGAAGGGQAAAPKNLQVLPAKLTTPEVVTVMQTFTAALGVTCAHCHVFVANGSPMNDMASDMKPQKNIARAMLRMANDINARLSTVIQKPADQRTKVECMTCHRGSAIPTNTAPAAPGRGGRGAPPAA